ncbi:cytochrome P450 CYP82D47-like [Iris pallida]|uniref:Cytochrome P450 CYP82D47-like n=1 Tax=Iris pallida TaxID=29817 RepID=A0AAX6F364_IRIPA|nr:cytochrome P450 CYP82D47-like [Iris pallida]
MPGHALLPDPKGMSSKCWPLTSTLPPDMNLSGLNSSGSGHTLGSRCSFQMFTITWVPAGTRNPCISHSSVASCGTFSCADGYRRNTSLTTARR